MGDDVTELRRKIANRKVLVVAGTGVSRAATNDAPEASWHGLLQAGLERATSARADLDRRRVDVVRTQIELGDARSLMTAAEQITSWFGGAESQRFKEWLQGTIEALPLREPAVPEALWSLGVPVATTNYDTLIEQANAGTRTVTWCNPDEMHHVLTGRVTDAVLHLHGAWNESKSVVFGTSSYEARIRDETAQALQHAFGLVYSLLFVGVGAGQDDPNIGGLLEWLEGIRTGNVHYVLCTKEDAAKFPPRPHVVPIVYGSSHTKLAPFLRGLAPGGRPPEDTGDRSALPGPPERPDQPKDRKARGKALAALVIIPAVAGAFALLRYQGEAGDKPEAQATPITRETTPPPSPPATLAPIRLDAPVDRVDLLSLRWSSSPGLSYVIELVADTGTSKKYEVGQAARATVPVDPDERYCVSVVGVDEVHERSVQSNVRQVRGALCRFD